MKAMTASNKYRAFISYSSRDAKWGKWLHKRLENYTIPDGFRQIEFSDGKKLGKHIRPVFRDRDELAGSAELGPAILEALKNSCFLIVLCSLNSAQSKWVNKEIEDFRAIHGDRKVLALILDGEPNASTNPKLDDDLECFPPALRLPLEPLAGDLRAEADGKERGFLKILAGIADIGFDDLYRRHERAQRKRRLFIGTFAVGIIAALAGLSIFALTQKSIAEAQTVIAEQQTQKANEETKRANEQTEIARKKTRETEKALTQVENTVDSLTDTYADLDIKEVRKNDQPLEAVLASRLLATANKITPESIDDIELVTRVRSRLAQSLLSLGYPREATQLFQQALETTLEQHDPISPQSIQMMHNLAIALGRSGNPADAERLHQEVLKHRVEKLGPSHRDTIVTRQSIAESKAAMGDLGMAHQLNRQLFKTCVSEFGEFDSLSVTAANNLATSHSTVGDNDAGIELLEKVVPIFETQRGPEHVDTLALKNNLAILYSQGGNLANAKKTLSQVVDSQSRVLGETHPDTILATSSLGSICLQLNQLSMATPLIEKSWQNCLNRLSESNTTRLQCAVNLAALEDATGRSEQALERLRGVVDVYKKHFAGDHQLVIGYQNNLASMLLRDKKKNEEAEQILKAAMASAESNLGEAHPLKFSLRLNMAQAIAYNHGAEDGLAYSKETLRLCEQHLNDSHPIKLQARFLVALMLSLNEKHEEAKILLEETVTMLEAKFGRKHPTTLNAIANLGVVYRSLGDNQKSVDLLSEVAYSDMQHPSLTWAKEQLGVSQMKRAPAVGLQRLVENELAKSRQKNVDNPAALAKDLLVSANALMQAGALDDADKLVRDAIQTYESIEAGSWESLYAKGKFGELQRLQKTFVEAEQTLIATLDAMLEFRNGASDSQQKQFMEIARHLFYVYSQSGEKDKVPQWRERRDAWFRK